MFKIDDSDIKKLEADIKTFASRSLPFATKKTLNDAAFAAMKMSRADIKSNMVTRNSFTVSSVRVNQARTLNIGRQAATVGSTADYMEDQEFGATKQKKGKEGVNIPTSYSAGQGEGAGVRTRLPRKANKMAMINLGNKRIRAQSRKQQNLIAIQQAATTGRKFVFLELQRSKGIFKVVGGKRRPKIKMVHDLSRNSVIIPKNPWLKPAFDDAARMVPAFYADALRFQAKRNGLFTSN
jgi:hypothetical protein